MGWYSCPCCSGADILVCHRVCEREGVLAFAERTRIVRGADMPAPPSTGRSTSPCHPAFALAGVRFLQSAAAPSRRFFPLVLQCFSTNFPAQNPYHFSHTTEEKKHATSPTRKRQAF